MNIMTISKCLPYIAGPAVFAFEEAKMLVRMGHSVDFITYVRYPKGAAQNFDQALLEKSGINFHFVEIDGHDKVIGTSTEIALLSAALRVAKTKRFDFVNAHFAIPHGLVAIQVAKLLNIPSVVTLHGSDVWTLPNDTQFDEASRLVFQKANLLIAVSESLKQEALALLEPSERRIIEVLPIGVDLQRFAPIIPRQITETKAPQFLYVGRLEKVKRLDILVKAFKRVLQKLPEARLTIIGVGSEEENLRHLIGQELKIDQAVKIILGEFVNLPNFLQAADIFVLTSEREGFPNSLCEAAAAGLPIITTKVGSVADFFQEGHHCFYVKTNDAKNLAYRMKQLANNKFWRQTMSAKNLTLAQEHFDLKKRCQRLLELVRKSK